MSVPINKATPRAILLGVDDQSTRALPLEPEQLPQHLPLVFLHTEKDEEMMIGSGASLISNYGAKTFDPNSPFYNHQTALTEAILATGNQVMVKPIKLPGASTATVRISVETVATTMTDSEGNESIITRLIYHADQVTSAVTGAGMGQGTILAEYRNGAETTAVDGSLLSELKKEDGTVYSATSSLVPLFDLSVPYRGDAGNRVGFSIDAPIDTDPFPTNQALAETLDSFIYRLTMYQRPETSNTPKVVFNNYSSLSTDFVLKPHASDPNSGQEMSFEDIVIGMYATDGDAESGPRKAPFNNVVVYKDNIEAVARLIAGGYTVEGVDSAGAIQSFDVPGLWQTEEQVQENLYRINLFTGQSYDGVPYLNMTVNESVKFGGIRLGKNSVIYATGGSDGVPYKNLAIDRMETLRLYDEEVRNWCTYDFVEENPVFDSAMYPFSTLWDSGFSMPTKLAMLLPMGRTKRVWVGLATHSVADYLDPNATELEFVELPQLTGSEEVSRASALRTAAAVYPESEIFGTPSMRAIVVGRSGKLLSGRVNTYLPLTLAVAAKVGAYCGAGNGVWNPDYAFDSGNNKRETMFTDVNVTYQSREVYNKSWDAGMIWVQQFDRSSRYFPAFQTVYPNDTSVLNSLFFIIAASYLERVCEIVHRVLTGDQKLSRDEFAEKSDQLIIELTEGKFDDRFMIKPRTFYTQADAIRGYSWTTEIRVYAENMRTVGTFSIIGQRMEDYEG